MERICSCRMLRTSNWRADIGCQGLLVVNFFHSTSTSLPQCRVGTTQCQLGKAGENCVEAWGGRVARAAGGHSSLRTD